MMKPVTALFALILCAMAAPAQAWDHSRKHVYYNPVLTSSSAPHSYEHAPKRKKRYRSCRKNRHSRCAKSHVSARPALTRKVIYADRCHDRYKSCGATRRVHHCKTSCKRCKPNCRVVNNVVKEVNGGAPRYVVNGTVKICEEPEYRERGSYGNFHWQWRQQDPHYTKTPVYNNVDHGKTTIHTPGRHYRAQQTYYHR